MGSGDIAVFGATISLPDQGFLGNSLNCGHVFYSYVGFYSALFVSRLRVFSSACNLPAMGFKVG
jgi:hypothetical protein